MEYVDKDVSIYQTDDGKEFDDKEDAVLHEKLLNKYPKFCEHDIEWIEQYINSYGEDEAEDNIYTAFDSDQVVILMTNSDQEYPEYAEVDAHPMAIKAVIKTMDGRTIGMGCNNYVSGVVYKKESFSYNNERHGPNKKGKYTYPGGSGRLINDFLAQ